MVFILGRMGDNKRALMLIINRLDDVQRVQEHKLHLDVAIHIL